MCEVRNNGERDGVSRRERDGGTEKWTDFQRASRNRKLPLVRSGFFCLSYGRLLYAKHSICKCISSGTAMHHALAVSFVRCTALSIDGHRWPGSLPLMSD